MMIYTRNTSGAIRKSRKKKPTKAYLLALEKHVKYLRSLGVNCDDTGKVIVKRSVAQPGSAFGLGPKGQRFESSHSDQKSKEEIYASMAPAVKADNSWKIEASKNFTIVPAYNKGPYMVVAKEDLKTAGRKV